MGPQLRHLPHCSCGPGSKSQRLATGPSMVHNAKHTVALTADRTSTTPDSSVSLAAISVASEGAKRESTLAVAVEEV